MELHELKNTWMVLDEKLKKNEILNKQMLQEILQKKSNKSLSKLIRGELSNLIISMLMIPFCLWVYLEKNPTSGNYLSVKILVIGAIVSFVLGVIWYSCKLLKYLMKIDFSKSIKNNLFCLNKYTIMLKKEKLITYLIMAPFGLIFGGFAFYEFRASATQWSILGAVVATSTLFVYWMYKRIYDASIQTIKQSLEELEELKD